MPAVTRSFHSTLFRRAHREGAGRAVPPAHDADPAHGAGPPAHGADPAHPAPARPSARSLGRLSGLDGLRAIAVIAVLLYHAGILQGGFLGVDVFFVISGFLITALLLAEREATGRIDVVSFWLRRARRLLPALFLLLGSVLGFLVVFVPGEVATLRADVLAACAYSTNWFLILGHQSYFEAVGRPSPFRHLWSLAVEEQFYVLWPVLLAAALYLLRRSATLVLVLAAALVSAIWMAVLFEPFTDPSRVYYGTDTRLFGLLFGAALAFVWKPARERTLDPGWKTLAGIERRVSRRALAIDLVAVAGLATIGLFFAGFDEYSPFLYLGGFALLALVTAAVIAAVISPSGHVGPLLLDRRPLRWLGERSYSIYLWHWPVYMFTRPDLDVALDGPASLALRLGLTVLLAELSYRFVETPIRRGALGSIWRRWRSVPLSRRRASYRWLVPAGSVFTVLAIIFAADVASASVPPLPAYLAAGSIDTVVSPTGGPGAAASPAGSAGPASSKSARPLPGASGHSSSAPGGGPNGPTAGPASSIASVPGPPRSPAPTVSFATVGPPPGPTPPPYPDRVECGRVFAIGDSVMLGAVSELGRNVDDLEMTAAVGRFWKDGVAIARERLTTAPSPEAIVIDLGSNERIFDRDFDAMMAGLSGVKLVVFVNLRVPRDWEARDNLTLASGVHRYANARLVDWHAASAGHPGLFWNDGIHLRPDGAKLYARLIADALRNSPAPAG